MRKLMFVVSALFGVACGSGGGGTSSGFNPGVAGSKSLNTLTPAEVQTVCTNLEAAISAPAFLDEECRSVGVEAASFASAFGAAPTDADLQMACAGAYSDCKASVSDPDGGADDSTCTGPDASCKATVDQLTACVNELLATLQSEAVPSCSTLTNADLATVVASAGDAGADPSSGPACTAYAKACPDDAIGDTTSALTIMKSRLRKH